MQLHWMSNKNFDRNSDRKSQKWKNLNFQHRPLQIRQTVIPPNRLSEMRDTGDFRAKLIHNSLDSVVYLFYSVKIVHNESSGNNGSNVMNGAYILNESPKQRGVWWLAGW